MPKHRPPVPARPEPPPSDPIRHAAALAQALGHVGGAGTTVLPEQILHPFPSQPARHLLLLDPIARPTTGTIWNLFCNGFALDSLLQIDLARVVCSSDSHPVDLLTEAEVRQRLPGRDHVRLLEEEVDPRDARRVRRKDGHGYLHHKPRNVARPGLTLPHLKSLPGIVSADTRLPRPGKAALTASVEVQPDIVTSAYRAGDPAWCSKLSGGVHHGLSRFEAQVAVLLHVIEETRLSATADFSALIGVPACGTSLNYLELYVDFDVADPVPTLRKLWAQFRVAFPAARRRQKAGRLIFTSKAGSSVLVKLYYTPLRPGRIRFEVCVYGGHDLLRWIRDQRGEMPVDEIAGHLLAFFCHYALTLFAIEARTVLEPPNVHEAFRRLIEQGFIGPGAGWRSKTRALAGSVLQELSRGLAFERRVLDPKGRVAKHLEAIGLVTTLRAGDDARVVWCRLADPYLWWVNGGRGPQAFRAHWRRLVRSGPAASNRSRRPRGNALMQLGDVELVEAVVAELTTDWTSRKRLLDRMLVGAKNRGRVRARIERVLAELTAEGAATQLAGNYRLSTQRKAAA